MLTIATSNDNINDIYVNSSGNLAISQKADALANISKNTVLTNYGELEYNTEKGVPYFKTIFADVPLIDLFQASIVQTLSELDKVQRVSNFEYTVKDGIFSYSVKEKTDYGEIILNG